MVGASGESSGNRPPSLLDVQALEAERRRLVQALALAERDLRLLGYEIHDGIVQDLTAAVLLLEGAGRQATFPSSETEESYQGGLRLLRETIAEARRLIRGLATVELDERGLVVTLQRLVDKFRTEHGLPATFVSDVPSLPLAASVQHLLLRIAQEALYNAWKHAQASRVEVCLTGGGDHLELSITDDGVGFDPSQRLAGHYGLEGMRARARVLDAELEIQSAKGQGTRVQVRLPMPANSNNRCSPPP